MRRHLLLYLKYRPEKKNKAFSSTSDNPVRSLPFSSSFIQTLNPSWEPGGLCLAVSSPLCLFPEMFPRHRHSPTQSAESGSRAQVQFTRWAPWSCRVEAPELSSCWSHGPVLAASSFQAHLPLFGPKRVVLLPLVLDRAVLLYTASCKLSNDASIITSRAYFLTNF